MVGLVLLLLFTFSMMHLSVRWFYRCFHDALVRTVKIVNNAKDFAFALGDWCRSVVWCRQCY